MTNSKTFEELGITDNWVQALHKLEITSPTPIQQETFPVILAGKDIIAQSQTGTGKTLAYVLPILQQIDAASKNVQAVVLVPTRELGMQVVRVIEQLAQKSESGIRVLGLIGGAALSRQVDRLKQNPHVVVGTPGRILELLNMRKLSVHHVKTAVIDEVDQVLTLGSARDVDKILKKMMRSRQLLFFSATITDDVHREAESQLTDPVHIAINPSQRTAETIEHMYFVTDERNKMDTLRRLVHSYKPNSAIVFTNVTSDVEDTLSKMKYLGLSVESLHGEAGKNERAQVMQNFRSGKFKLLLATDVAARGLDIEGVTHIFHLDPAPNAEYYLHRVGRTGRMGRQGTAISIVTPPEVWILDKLGKQLGIQIEPKEMYEGKAVAPGTGAKMRATRQSAERKVASTSATPTATSTSVPKTGDKAVVKGQPVGNGSPVSERKPKATVNQTQAAPIKKKNKKEEARERKNKGAPKWLKAKDQQKE
ncbi:DEAD/DEAH box helicase [Paenibacillus sp. N1-5-1-14]|uniref:DEAD/DEAH box helicase n=1 Tax=Paenibacillus radicibacter TaxID=2972488 RepID=UPI0021594A99|nr:DEAD/DEAH box helicase [Paenibacillus radicibacter]MCR8645226.1 DEAD/DEAH box helicase [Paenibacillus radicibacter]